jgi:hypothetical protein
MRRHSRGRQAGARLPIEGERPITEETIHKAEIGETELTEEGEEETEEGE